MGIVVVSLLVIGSVTPSATAAAQRRSGEAAATSGQGACSLLSRELVEKVLGDSVNKTLLGLRPTEERIGKSGSACHYAGITLQIDALTPKELEAMREKGGTDWVPVPGVGDVAYFRNNQNLFAEVLGRIGSRTFSILMGIQKSPIEKVKPNVIAIASAVVPKLR